MNNLLLQPKSFNIFGLTVSWYGVIVALGMLLGVVSAYIICKKKDYDTNMPLELALYALPCAIIGARLYYCIFNLSFKEPAEPMFIIYSISKLSINI